MRSSFDLRPHIPACRCQLNRAQREPQRRQKHEGDGRPLEIRLGQIQKVWAHQAGDEEHRQQSRDHGERGNDGRISDLGHGADGAGDAAQTGTGDRHGPAGPLAAQRRLTIPFVRSSLRIR